MHNLTDLFDTYYLSLTWTDEIPEKGQINLYIGSVEKCFSKHCDFSAASELDVQVAN